MKTINKKILTGTLAASVLLGGGITGALYNKAFAAENGTGTAATATDAASAAGPTGGKFFKGAGNGKHGGEGFGFRGLNLAQETATILGVDLTAVQDLQKQGKTLSQIAQDKGVTEEVLLQKLTDAASKSIDAAVTAGKVTQAQADQQKTNLADRLKHEVAENHPNDGRGERGPGHGKEGREGGFVDRAALSQIIGVTEQELKTDLQAGKSVVEIAQGKGIAKDQLIGKIKDGLTDKITQFVDRKDTRPAKTPAATPAPAASAAPAAN